MHSFVPEVPKNTSAGTETHRNVPACARVGTLRHQIVPGAPEEHQKSTGRAPDKRQELSGRKKNGTPGSVPRNIWGGKKTTRLSPLPRMLSKVSPERLKVPAGSLRSPL